MSDDLNISPTRQAVKDFLKATLKNPLYKFDIVGLPEEATAFVQRMRVDLSRIRAELQAQNIRVAQFKVYLIGTEYDRAKHTTTITLEKRTAKHTGVLSEVRDIMSELTEGGK